MAEISIGGAVGAGFDLIRRKPWAVLTWGLVQVLFSALSFSLLAPMMLANFALLAHQAQSGSPMPPASMQTMMQMQSVSYLLNFVGILVSTVFSCAIFRAVLRPEEDRFAYLRIGSAELMLALLLVGAVFAFGIGVGLAAIVVGLVIGLLVVLHAGVVAAIVGVVAAVAAIVVLVYLGLRLSLVGPMTVDDGKFRLTEAWALSRGHVASLLGVALVVLLVLTAIEIVVGLIMVAVGLGVLASVAGGLSNLATFFQQPPQVMIGRLVPMLIVLAVVWIPLSGCILAIVSAPWARAYRDLRPAGDISETFV